jgi:threonine dehydrogenase-like Zn-dependent dehydrogenase
VLVAVRSVGVCGSDVHYFQHGRIGDFVLRDPLVLGHEVSGRVVAAGPGAVSLDALVTDRFPLAQAEQALRAVTQEGTIKPVVEPWH